MSKTNPKVSHRLVLGPYKVQKEMKCTQSSQAVQNGAAYKSLSEKKIDIQAMFNHPLEVPLITCKGSFSNGKLQASI